MIVKTSQGQKDACKITKGVLQGETLSPIFYSLFISDLADFLEKKGVRGVQLDRIVAAIALAFADDMFFLADSPIHLKKILVYLEEYLDLNKLELNVDKTKVIIFSKGGYSSSTKNLKFSFKGRNIEIVKSYMSKSYKAIQPTINILNKISVCNIATSRKLFNALVSSTALHAAPVWCPRYIEEREKIQNKFFRKLYLLPCNTPGYAIRSEFKLESMELRCFRLVLNYTQKILEMGDKRFPKICFNRAKYLSQFDNSTPKYNWYVQVKQTFFNKINESEFWDNITLNKLKSEKNNLLKKMKYYREEIDKVQCLSSTSLYIYPIIFMETQESYYLNLYIPNYFKKIIAQLRLFNIYVPRISLKNLIYKPINNYCEYCAENNDLLHRLIFCEYYTKYRDKLLPELKTDGNRLANFVSLMNNLNESRIRKLVSLLHIIANKDKSE